MEVAAVDLLERVLRRRRWSANDKDAIAKFLERLVRKEMNAPKRAAMKAESKETNDDE